MRYFLTGATGFASERVTYQPRAAGAIHLSDNSRGRRVPGFAPRSPREGLPKTLEHDMRLRGMG